MALARAACVLQINLSSQHAVLSCKSKLKVDDEKEAFFELK